MMNRKPMREQRSGLVVSVSSLFDTPPLRLRLGKAALELARETLDSMRSDVDPWEKTTPDADFPLQV